MRKLYISLFLPLCFSSLAAIACNDDDKGSEDVTDPNAWRAELDPEMTQVIGQLESLGGQPIESLSAAQARLQPTPADAVNALLTEQGKDTRPEVMGSIDNVSITGAAGNIPARIYVPTAGIQPYPVVVYYHGGGFVLATIDTYDASARALANTAGAIVVSVEYRKAPENKFPAAHDDAFASYRWVLDHAASIGGDPLRVAVAGESAGGNLAASVSLRARDSGIALPVHQLLIYPIAGKDEDTDSYQDNATAKPLNRAMMQWFFNQYLTQPSEINDPRIDLVDANLRGLPATTIINAEIDPLLDDGEKLAGKLRDAGVPVEQKTYAGVTHEFFGMKAALPDAQAAISYAASRLAQSF